MYYSFLPTSYNLEDPDWRRYTVQKNHSQKKYTPNAETFYGYSGNEEVREKLSGKSKSDRKHSALQKKDRDVGKSHLAICGGR